EGPCRCRRGPSWFTLGSAQPIRISPTPPQKRRARTKMRRGGGGKKQNRWGAGLGARGEGPAERRERGRTRKNMKHFGTRGGGALTRRGRRARDARGAPALRSTVSRLVVPRGV